MGNTVDSNQAKRRRGRPPTDADPKKTGLYRLGTALRGMREAEGIGLRKFAEKVGYEPSHVSRVERAQVTPSPEFVEACDRELQSDGRLRSLLALVHAEQAERRLRARGASPTPAAPPKEGPEPLYPGDRSDFVADLTVPDGSRVEPQEKLLKRWRIRNAGKVPWVGRMLRRDGALGGDQIIRSPRDVPIPAAAPGETADIEVEISAPRLPGSVEAYWRMVDEDGRTCFPDPWYPYGIYVRLQVVGPGPAGAMDSRSTSR